MTSPPAPARIRAEIALVLAITFGASGLRAIARLLDSLLTDPNLANQSVTLNSNLANSPGLDFVLQLVGAAALIGWGALAWYLLDASAVRNVPGTLRRSDWGWGALLAAVIGIPGLAWYLGSVILGVNKQVVPVDAQQTWWLGAALLVWAFANAFAEEMVVVAYLATRLGQLRWGPVAIVAASALLRGSYHLYQGIGGGLGNVAMGVLFAIVWLRWRRVWPLIVAHFLIDAVVFLGYPVVSHLLPLPSNS